MPDEAAVPPPDRPFPALEHLRWSARPRLHRPVLIVAFEGWNDAGDAATTAVRYLADQWRARPFASVDPEIFYDFTSTRPHVQFDDQGGREIVWPENVMSSASISNDLDVITLIGTEPQLRWRTFCTQITGLAQLFDVRLVITVGSLLTEVPHTRPTPVYGAAYDDDVTLELGLMPSRYEGPTGIVGILHDACIKADLQAAALWAAVPAYASQVPSPKATLALVERLGGIIGTTMPTARLEAEVGEYESRVTAIVAEDDDLAGYVRRLESMSDAGIEDFSLDDDDDIDEDEDDDDVVGGELEAELPETVDGPAFIDEVERFLRDQ